MNDPTKTPAFTSANTEERKEAYNAWRGKPVDQILAKSDELSKQMELAHSQAGESMDLSKIELGGKSSPVQEKATALVNLHSELAGVNDALTEQRELAAQAQAAQDIREQNRGGGPSDPQVDRVLDEIARRYNGRPDPAFDLFQQAKDQVREKFGLEKMGGPEFIRQIEDGGVTLNFDMRDKRALNAVFTTTSGDPFNYKDPGITPFPSREIQLIDLMPMVPIMQNSAVFTKETTRTTAAAAVAEGTAAPEATRVLTRETVPVETIASHIPATEEELEDEPMAEMYLTEDIGMEVKQACDGLLITGTGVTPQPVGLNSLTESRFQNFVTTGRTNPFDTLIDALTEVRIGGRAMPTHFVLHHQTWDEIIKEQSSSGGYLLGDPSMSFGSMAMGYPVVRSDHLTNATTNGSINGYCGDFTSRWIQMRIRRDLMVTFGMINTDFTQRQIRIMGTVRYALVVKRPEAFCRLGHGLT